MWIFTTKYGFLSAVCSRKGDGARTNPVDPDRIMVRVRDEQHLELLQADYPILGESKVISTPTADYCARLIVDKTAWASVMGQIIIATDYDNFKADAHCHETETGSKYVSVLFQVWQLVRQIQET